MVSFLLLEMPIPFTKDQKTEFLFVTVFYSQCLEKSKDIITFFLVYFSLSNITNISNSYNRKAFLKDQTIELFNDHISGFSRIKTWRVNYINVIIIYLSKFVAFEDRANSSNRWNIRLNLYFMFLLFTNNHSTKCRFSMVHFTHHYQSFFIFFMHFL